MSSAEAQAKGPVPTCGREMTGPYAEHIRTAGCEREPGHKGFCRFPAMTSGARRKPSMETRIKMGATRLQMDPDDYRRQVDAGNRWCSGHQQFEPSDAFGTHVRRGLNTRCRVADREAAGHESSRRTWEAAS